MSTKILIFSTLIITATILISNFNPTPSLNPHPQLSAQPQFQSFKSTHKKSYNSPSEQSYRKQIFLTNLQKIATHNADPTQTHTLGVTQFSDLTQEEFVFMYLRLRVEERIGGIGEVGVKGDGGVRRVGGEVDWVKVGKVTGVKDQAACGSCWAFSAVGAIESAYLLTGQSVILSEQQLVDCSGPYGNIGCFGGWMDSAFRYIIDRGLTTSAAYPYVAKDQTCVTNGGPYKISKFVDVPGCENLQNAITERPVSVAVDATNWSQYILGVISKCGQAINHGVLLVGSNSQTWKIKNSWGVGWGENGYARLAKGNTCSICSYPSYPIV